MTACKSIVPRIDDYPNRGLVFRRNGSDEENERLVERVNASGEIFITHTKLDERYVLRLAIGNARTTEDDVRRAWEVLNREAGR